MRLSNTSMFGQSNGLINVNRVNQSVVKQSPSEKGTHMMQIKKDFLTISPQGKSASIIDNLNKQKAHILEMRDQFVENARKQGQSEDVIKTQLEQFDEQIKNIDKQIQEATLKKMQDVAEKSAPKIKNSKYRTKQDVQNDILTNITTASTTLDRIETVNSEKNKLDGNMDVLKSEIELDKSRSSAGSSQKTIATKEELVSQMQRRSQGLMQDISDGLNEANEILEENSELSETKPVEDDKDANKGKINPADSDKSYDIESVSARKDWKEFMKKV